MKKEILFEQKAFYIVYAGDGATTEGMVSENAFSDLDKANRIADKWANIYKWGYINRTIPGTPDTIIRKWGLK